MQDRIGDELAQAYEDGYQKGLEENKENNNKLRNLQRAIIADAKNRKEKVVAIDKKTFEEIKGKEIRLKFATEILEQMKLYNKKELDNCELTNSQGE